MRNVHHRIPGRSLHPTRCGVRRSALSILICLSILTCLEGCAAPPPASPAGAAPLSSAPADLTLDQITPKPLLLAPRSPTTRLSTAAARRALDLFAQAHIALLDNRRFAVITLLKQAIAIDPDSFELYHELGKAWLGVSDGRPQAIAALTQAAAIRPRSFAVQLRLGQLHAAEGDIGQAICHLRLALMIDPAGRDGSRRAMARLLLARALEQKGYDRAALEQYRLLLDALEHPDGSMRRNPRMIYLASRPDGLYLDIARLYEKRRRFDNALAIYQQVLDHDDSNMEAWSGLIRTGSALGQGDQVEKRLIDALGRHSDDAQLVEQLIMFHVEHFQMRRAAGVIIETIARRPGLLREIGPFWGKLIEPGRKNRLSSAEVQQIGVSASAEASKLYWVSRQAVIEGRGRAAKEALEKAVQITPPFGPAYQALLSEYWEGSTSLAEKIRASQTLAQLARRKGNAVLAAQLLGISLLNQAKPAAAAVEFNRAIHHGGGNLPDPVFLYALSLQRQKNMKGYERVLWKLAGDHPAYDDAWEALMGYYMSDGDAKGALNALSQWLEQNPSSIGGQLARASIYAQAGRMAAAERGLIQLLDSDEDNPRILAALRGLYAQVNRSGDFISLLQAHQRQSPRAANLLTALVDAYVENGRAADAVRMLDQSRAAAAANPQWLYFLSSLYARIGHQTTAEAVLEEVIRIDPDHAGACNDLGYAWADAGKNLQQAERLIRRAATADPGNPSFLDSLGWVLYKRGQFESASRSLQQAIDEAGRMADPVIYNHLGDALWRLGRRPRAVRAWQTALDRLERNKADENQAGRKSLTEALQHKIAQADRGDPAVAAPSK